MTLDEMRACYRVLCLPTNGVKELHWYKQLLDLTYDMILALNRNSNTEEETILAAFREMMKIKILVVEQPFGWKAKLHKTWRDYIKSGQKQKVHPEYDASTKRWIWLQNESTGKFDWLLKEDD